MFDLFGSAPVSSGVSVTPASAMRCTAVRCAVRAISEAIGQLPVHVYAKAEDGTKKRDTSHPVHAILHDAVSDFVSASEFKELLTADAILYGNGFAFVNRSSTGRPVELNRLPPETVTVDADIHGPVYRVEGRIWPTADIFHLRAPSSIAGAVHFRGASIVHEAREAIGLALTLELHAARLFGNGAKPSGILTLDGNPNAEAIGRAKAAWQNSHGGSKSGGTAVIPASAKYNQITLNPVDAQFLELRKFAIEEIARAFRVPPHMLYELGRATWSNSEQMGAEFVTYTLMPWITRWEGEIALKLFSAEERATISAKFNADALVRGDLAARANFYSQMISSRVFCPNDARRLENLPPYKDGDVFANPNTTTTKSTDD